MSAERDDLQRRREAHAAYGFDLAQPPKYQQAQIDTVAAELAKLREDYAECVGVLTTLFPGDPVDDKVGWCAHNSSDKNLFKCEFCAAEDLDCTLIPHRADCFVIKSRSLLSKAKGRAG